MKNKTALYQGNKSLAIIEREISSPGPGEVRLDVAYCGICGTDRHIFHGVMDGRVGRDAVIGHEMSGVIAETGPGTQGFHPGDRVVVRPLDWCGRCPTCKRGHTHICEALNFIGVDSEGAFQSSWIVNQRILHRIPEEVGLKKAALAEPLSVAVHDVRRSGAAPGETALIIGGGPIGILIALLLKRKGVDCLLSEINEARLAVAASLGIPTVDPRQEDPAKRIKEKNRGSLADVVFEVSASRPGALDMSAFARPRGRIVLVGIYGQNPEVCLKDFFLKELEMSGARVYEEEDVDEALRTLADKDFPGESLISKIYDLEQIGAAFQELDEDLSAMKILIKCGESE